MTQQLGRIVILNGAPRSGKSSIAAAMQTRLDGVWVNLGVDVYRQAMPDKLQPSIGLRPGGERPDIEVHLPILFAALYDSVAAHSRLGLNVVVDIGHHDAYSTPLHLFADSLRRVQCLPVFLIGVRCALPAILERRSTPQVGREGSYLECSTDGVVPAPILAWQHEVHRPGIYDLEMDMAVLSPEQGCDTIGDLLRNGTPQPSAIRRILEASGL